MPELVADAAAVPVGALYRRAGKQLAAQMQQASERCGVRARLPPCRGPYRALDAGADGAAASIARRGEADVSRLALWKGSRPGVQVFFIAASELACGFLNPPPSWPISESP